MNWKTLLLIVVLVDFAAFSAYVMLEVGYFGIWAAGFSGPGAMQILFDLVIVASLSCVWMWNDSKTSGLSPWPYILITLTAGSFGPLFYLLRRQLRHSGASNPTAPALG